MGTEPWVDHQQATWNVLPLRPRPQPLESMTSYITRLAEANGLQSINELGALAGGMSLSSLKSSLADKINLPEKTPSLPSHWEINAVLPPNQGST
jgi:hypothetical protein